MTATMGFVCGAALMIVLMSMFSGWMLWLGIMAFLPGGVNFYWCFAVALVAHCAALCLTIINK